MRSNNRLRKAVVGEYNRICDEVGMPFKRGELVREPQTGRLVLAKFADPWHPLDLPYPVIRELKVRIE